MKQVNLWMSLILLSAGTALAADKTNLKSQNQARIDSGWVSGIATPTPGVRVFKGIPYAAPPVGNLRWRAPAPVVPWLGMRKADTFAAGCMQPTLPPTAFYYQGEYPMNEDCLYLNVWTSTKSPNERRPVLLWIHDGGMKYGRGSRAEYDGESLSKKGLVVVTINYRLGILGTLAHPELSRESANKVSGNYALLDMIAAIKWTRRNIEAFGGDPKRITLYGESVGSRAVSALATSPLVKGDIQGVIAGDTIWGGGPVLTDAERRGLELTKTANAASVEDLRRLPADQILNYSQFGYEFIGDGYVLTEKNIFAAQKNGTHPAIPILTGVTADFASAILPPVSAEEFAAQSRKQFGALAERFLALYPHASNAEAAESQRASWTDQITVMHAEWAAASTSSNHRRYFYWFTHAVPPRPEARTIYESAASLPERLGAYHTGEIAYAFDSLGKMDRTWTAADHQLANIMSNYWVNFVTQGDPNGPDLPSWPAYGNGENSVMELGDEVKVIALPLSGAKKEFWDNWFAGLASF